MLKIPNFLSKCNTRNLNNHQLLTFPIKIMAFKSQHFLCQHTLSLDLLSSGDWKLHLDGSILGLVGKRETHTHTHTHTHMSLGLRTYPWRWQATSRGAGLARATGSAGSALPGKSQALPSSPRPSLLSLHGFKLPHFTPGNNTALLLPEDTGLTQYLMVSEVSRGPASLVNRTVISDSVTNRWNQVWRAVVSLALMLTFYQAENNLLLSTG